MNYYPISDFLSLKTGNLNKRCRFCLKSDLPLETESILFIKIDDLDDLNFEIFFPKSIIIVQKLYDLDHINLVELFQDFNDEICRKTGYSFRITKSVEDHLYAKCRYSDEIQTKKIEKRQRNNFGAQKFECKGEIRYKEIKPALVF
jgi:hypothetical protein